MVGVVQPLFKPRNLHLWEVGLPCFCRRCCPGPILLPLLLLLALALVPQGRVPCDLCGSSRQNSGQATHETMISCPAGPCAAQLVRTRQEVEAGRPGILDVRPLAAGQGRRVGQATM